MFSFYLFLYYSSCFGAVHLLLYPQFMVQKSTRMVDLLERLVKNLKILIDIDVFLD